MTKILQIVPRISSASQSDGVFDYSFRLANHFRENSIESSFLTVRSTHEDPAEVAGFRVSQYEAQGTDSLVKIVDDETSCILLQMSAYPYILDKWNSPWDLYYQLKALLAKRDIDFITYFHELPTIKVAGCIVLNPLQAQFYSRLSQLSSHVFTNNSYYASILRQWVGANRLSVLQVFSNVGEPSFSPLLENRLPRIVVFGGSDRRRVYLNHHKRLLRTCRALKCREIFDVGPPIDLVDEIKNMSHDIDVVECGFLESRGISELLLTCKAGFVDYSRFPGCLGKSGVFAAYCAHRLVPICTQDPRSSRDALRHGQNYLLPLRSNQDLSSNELQDIADAACSWYQKHTSIVHSRRIMQVIRAQPHSTSRPE